MVSVEDKLNNFLILEHFTQLEQKNLKPKLGVYGGNRLVIVSQKRTNLYAKIYQLFLDVIYNPIQSLRGKLSFDARRIANLRSDIELLNSNFSDKQRVLQELTTRIEAQRQEIGTCESRITEANRKAEIADTQLREKEHVLQKCSIAETKISDLNLQITRIESYLEVLSNLEKQHAPAKQKINQLQETIQRLESQISALRINQEQLSYKERSEFLAHRVSSLTSALTEAQRKKCGICLRCGALV